MTMARSGTSCRSSTMMSFNAILVQRGHYTLLCDDIVHRRNDILKSTNNMREQP